MNRPVLCIQTVCLVILLGTESTLPEGAREGFQVYSGRLLISLYTTARQSMLLTVLSQLIDLDNLYEICYVELCRIDVELKITVFYDDAYCILRLMSLHQQAAAMNTVKPAGYEGRYVQGFQFYLKHSEEHKAILGYVDKVLPGEFTR